MRKLVEKLWDEYFYEECSRINTEEEKVLIKKAAEMHEAVNELLTNEQSKAVENFVDTLCEIQDSFVKSAFLKGCEFAASFLFEVESFRKDNP